MHSDRRIDKIKEIIKEALIIEFENINMYKMGLIPIGVYDAVAFIHKYLYDAELTSSFLQKHCIASRNKNFASIFKYYIGKTPNHYWLFYRVKAAKLLLIDKNLTEITVSDIAYSLGFNLPQTFTMIFKKYTDTTPNYYRKQNATDLNI